MKQRRINKLKQSIRDEAAAKYKQKIEICDDFDFMPLANSSCSLNVQHAVICKKAVSVVECVIIDDNSATAHYINQKDNGDYIDYTLGWAYSRDDYFLSRIIYIHAEHTHSMLSEFKSKLCDHHLTWFDKNILKITKWDLV